MKQEYTHCCWYLDNIGYYTVSHILIDQCSLLLHSLEQDYYIAWSLSASHHHMSRYKHQTPTDSICHWLTYKGMIHNIVCNICSPGQHPILQRAVKYRVPLHCWPPFLGDGLVHVLDFLLVPMPQLFEQPWSIHADQPPWTGGWEPADRNKSLWCKATRSLYIHTSSSNFSISYLVGIYKRKSFILKMQIRLHQQ